MSNKPVYVPSHKRKRFHGAFTGGFSAGYFNTVGTKDGWKPRENVVVQQNAQDYMDDQDFDEWGGPKSVKRDFSAAEEPRKQSASVLDWSIIQPPSNVGTRLLRCLGWREGSTAYVPDTDRDSKLSGDIDEETRTLSQKRLRKIQLQQKMVRIPIPKFDRGGLGYDIYRNAPEFQADRVKRRRDARHRAHAATISGGSNAYRLSDLYDKDDNVPPARNAEDRPTPGDVDEHSFSFETVQEFVGSKTAAGFAIRDDDDDVYDEGSLQKSALQINKDEYDTEIFEHESDVEDADATNKPSIGGILSSWATGDDTKTSNRGVTSDGRPPLSGFCLGGATTQDENTRFPGPEIPSNYVLKRHQFRDDEHPAQFQQIARREKVQERRQQALKRLADPMAGGTFSGLAAAMKSRFTSAVTPVATEVTPTPIGLHRPSSRVQPLEQNDEIVQKEVKKAIGIKITHLIFYPDVLVCKRLGVNPPVQSQNRVPEQKQSAESIFFEEEVMKRAAEARPKLATRTEGPDSILDEGHEMEPSSIYKRPPMDVLKAIYEPNSESEADDDDIGNLESASGELERSTDEQAIGFSATSTALVPVGQAMISATTTVIVPVVVQRVTSEKQDDETDERRHQKKRKRKKHEERRRHRDRSPSVSASESDLDESSSASEGEERRKYRTKRRRSKDEKKKSKDDKKRRKKRKSSRRYKD
jgi:G patch domain-containing protein 1